MKFTHWTVLAVALLSKGVCAQDYNNELLFGYTTTERGFADSVTYDVYYTYYVTPVQASTGPLAYAELIEHPSRVEIGYGFTDYDASSAIADADSTLTGFVGHYYKDNYGLLAGLVKQDGEMSSAQTSLTTDLDSTYYTLGAIYYPEDYTRLTLAYIWGDTTIRYSPIAIEDNIDFERIFVELEKLFFLPENRYLAFSGLVAREEQKDVSGREDGTDLTLDVDYFFTRFSGVAIRYTRQNGENSEDQDVYRVGYQTFLNYNTSLALFYQHDVGDLSSDSKEYSLEFTQRF